LLKRTTVQNILLLLIIIINTHTRIQRILFNNVAICVRCAHLRLFFARHVFIRIIRRIECISKKRNNREQTLESARSDESCIVRIYSNTHTHMTHALLLHTVCSRYELIIIWSLVAVFSRIVLRYSCSNYSVHFNII